MYGKELDIEILFRDEKNFTVGETFNKQNDRVYAYSSKEAHKLLPGIKRGHYPASVMIWLDGITSLLSCEKGVKTVARNYQQDILTNVV